MQLLAFVLVVAYSAAAAVIVLYAASQAHLLWTWARSRVPAVPAVPRERPKVTVQLPIYNERRVVKHLLDAVAALDWPRESLEIQLLDDSTDDTVSIAAEAIAALVARGLDAKHLRRPDRTGFKAGALAWGLERAEGELIAIFDADFRPRPDFLIRAVAALEEHPEWGLVQARWGHLNRDTSVFTAAQAFHLDAHFSIEQQARSQAPLLMGFNGTAGVWRRAAIDAAGGWSADTLTEDLDLAMRAQLAGWTLGYVDTIEAPAELPEEVPAVRSQQHRWMKGGAQVGRKLLPVLWAADRPLVTRLQATVHIAGGALFACVLALCVLSPLVGPLQSAVPWLRVALTPAGVGLQAALVVLVLFYAAMCVQREGGVVPGLARFVTTFPFFMALSAGLSLHNTLAVIEGWRGKPSPFVRTPKRGEATALALYAPERVGTVVWAELAIAAWGALGLVWAVSQAQWVLAVFLLSQAAGFAGVGLASVSRR
ncbi:MAG: glycosyltransferase [Alphaproteobacteria bacterium]|nr:glycosyltransferase [Alphaproteobacteria bacterium]